MSNKTPADCMMSCMNTAKTPRMAQPLKVGGSGTVYPVSKNYGKPTNLGKINTPLKKR